jgi:uncharacterized caspase-like protein
MSRLLRLCICVQVIGLASLCPRSAYADEPTIAVQEATESRVALVIGQSDYSAFPLPSAAADAAVIANNLEEASFDVESGVDLPEYGISEKLSSFIGKINLSGPNTIGVIYISGRFAQINGENLLLPVSTKIDRASDAALYSYSIRKLLSALASVPMRACVVMIDASAPPESLAGEKTFAPGLAIVDPPKGFLLAYSQNPGMALTNPSSETGHFAKAFLEALQQPTDSFPDFFKIIRVRIYDETGGAQRTWEADKLTDPSFFFFVRQDDAPPPAPLVDLSDQEASVASLPREEAFKKVIALDTIQSYQSFIKAFPDDEALPNIQYNLAVRREAEVWADALRLDTAEAYWTYLKTYPDGGNVGVARERLARLGEPGVQPDNFTLVNFDDIPPPLDSGEIIASSASMPVDFLPPPPSMGLPVVPVAVVAAIAAAAAFPGVSGKGPRAVPTMGAASVRPTWAAPVSVNSNGFARQPTAPAFAAPAPPRTVPVVARPAGAVLSASPLAAGAGRPGVQPLSPSGAAQAVRPLTPVAPTAPHPAAGAPPAVVPGTAASGVKPVGAIAPTTSKPFAGVQGIGTASARPNQIQQRALPAATTSAPQLFGGRASGAPAATASPLGMRLATQPAGMGMPAHQMTAPQQPRMPPSTPQMAIPQQPRMAMPQAAAARMPAASPPPPPRKCPPNAKSC